MLVRAAAARDAEAIRSIYAHHVRHGVGTFEEDPPGLAEIGSRMTRGHWVVAEAGGRVVGYAYYGPYRERSAYRFTVEDSVYVRPDTTGRGVGSRLLATLVEHARAAGYRQMVAAIGSSDNLASIALHRRHGFAHVGVLSAVGHKFGRDLDVVLLQRAL